MTKQEKQATIEGLKEQLSKYNSFYFADASALTVNEVTQFRKNCFTNGIEMTVYKNSLIQKAMEATDKVKYEGLFGALKGATAVMFCETANAPAKVIKNFRKDGKHPVLKAAFIESAIYLGDQNLSTLSNLKSKKELLGEIIGLLQSPAKNVISALQSGGHKISGVLKTLSEKK